MKNKIAAYDAGLLQQMWGKINKRHGEHSKRWNIPIIGVTFLKHKQMLVSNTAHKLKSLRGDQVFAFVIKACFLSFLDIYFFNTALNVRHTHTHNNNNNF